MPGQRTDVANRELDRQIVALIRQGKTADEIQEEVHCRKERIIRIMARENQLYEFQEKLRTNSDPLGITNIVMEGITACLPNGHPDHKSRLAYMEMLNEYCHNIIGQVVEGNFRNVLGMKALPEAQTYNKKIEISMTTTEPSLSLPLNLETEENLGQVLVGNNFHVKPLPVFEENTNG